MLLSFDGDVGPVMSLNTPPCAGNGEVRGLIEGLPIATEQEPGVDLFESDCTSSLDNPADVAAFTNGFVTLTEVPEELVLAKPEVVRAGDPSDDGTDEVAPVVTVEPATVAAAGPADFTVSASQISTANAIVLPGPAPQPCVSGPIDATGLDEDSVDMSQITTVAVDDGIFTVDVTYDVPPEGIIVVVVESADALPVAIAVCLE